MQKKESLYSHGFVVNAKVAPEGWAVTAQPSRTTFVNAP